MEPVVVRVSDPELKSTVPALMERLAQVRLLVPILRVPAPDLRMPGCVAPDFGVKVCVPVAAVKLRTPELALRVPKEPKSAFPVVIDTVFVPKVMAPPEAVREGTEWERLEEPQSQVPALMDKSPAERALVATATVPAPDLEMGGKAAPLLGVKVWVPDAAEKTNVPVPNVTPWPEIKVALPEVTFRI